MLRSVHGKTLVLSKKGRKKLDKHQSHAKLVVIKNEHYKKKKYETLQIDGENTKIKFYQDEEDLYITNFDQKQDILNCPIDALLIFDKHFEIYISQTMLCGTISQLQDPTLEFFMEKDQEEKMEPLFKKSKMSKTTEDDQYYNYDDSEELGIRTSSYEELPANSPPVSAPNSPNRSESLFSTTSDSLSSNQSPDNEIIHETTAKNGRKRSSPQIKSSGLDIKIQRTLEISRCKTRFEKLFDDHYSCDQKIIPCSQLVSSVSENDIIVQRFLDFAKSSGSIPEADPLTVYNRESEYHVLSGSRRAMAYRLHGIEKVAVHAVKAEDVPMYKLKKFFSETVEEEPDVCKMIDICYALFDYLDVLPQTIKRWTEKEFVDVFGKYFKKNTKLELILKMTAHDNLIFHLKKLCANGRSFGNRAYLLILNRFLTNPEDTLRVLRVAANSGLNEKQLKSELSKVKTSTSCILQKKVTDPVVINKLMDRFKDDSKFEEFAKRSDLRKKSCVDHFVTICRRFDVYKKATNSLPHSEATKVIKVVKTPSKSDFILTTDENVIEEWLIDDSDFLTEDQTAVLLGRNSENGSFSFILILPDSMADRGADGCLQAHISATLFIRRNGCLLKEHHVKQFFNDHDLPFRSFYYLEEISRIVKEDTPCFVKINKMLAIDISSSIIKNATNVAVDSEEHKEAFNDFILS
ncbi:hypothetical protein CRE_24253 [Caenorhabditis remanei]|uniref:Uncharacterized protein n=1 Tax=Caenorhabditis remanei TaxID=31234 RepID=E3NHP7_CAERE|nr:hypothetical protein CRE_24253 [Caenorhabditis remanei]